MCGVHEYVRVTARFDNDRCYELFMNMWESVYGVGAWVCGAYVYDAYVYDACVYDACVYEYVGECVRRRCMCL